jgi:hypothetical protein
VEREGGISCREMVVSWLSLVSLTRSRGFGPVHMHVCLQACLSFARTYYDRHIGERVCERLGAGFIFSKMVAMTWWDGHTNSLSAFGISNQMSTLRCWFERMRELFPALDLRAVERGRDGYVASFRCALLSPTSSSAVL